MFTLVNKNVYTSGLWGQYVEMNGKCEKKLNIFSSCVQKKKKSGINLKINLKRPSTRA